MKSFGIAALALAGTLAFAGTGKAECTAENWQDCAGKPWVDGDKMETPLGAKWWPNPLWGAGDEAGSTNWYTKPEVIMRAMAQVKTGKAFKIGHPYTADMPLFGARKFTLRIPGAPTGGAFGGNQVMWNDEFLATEIGQVGTQFDGLGHIGVNIGKGGNKSEMRWYNGITAEEMITPYGLVKLGTEKLHPIIARGIMLDIAAVRGVDSMQKGEVITMEDVRAALKKQGMEGFEFAEGDAIIFRTGWEKHWDNPAVYNDGCPGIGMEVARWIAEDVKAGVTGGDTWPVDAVPNPDPGCVFCVHTFLQTRHGIVNQENLKLSELSAAGVYQFAYVYSPAPITGATGSMGAPIAIH
ncbi:cyclase family protein [Nisaea acidiphila]|uniref:Cyclase family protein n=1 Tax=Nisaea acidiphila TaxID=1862145 RepID=A0A9J7AQH2_9PROT|nr:cyclase family protein [Nisaea acidiphila]UUX49851.1 cyclase family protein [Nisaea acidiphila]